MDHLLSKEKALYIPDVNDRLSYSVLRDHSSLKKNRSLKIE